MLVCRRQLLTAVGRVRIEGMSEAPPTRRRWFQISSGTLLLLVTLVAVSLFGAKECVHHVYMPSSRQVLLEAEMEGLRNANTYAAAISHDAKLLKLEEALQVYSRCLSYFRGANSQRKGQSDDATGRKDKRLAESQDRCTQR